MAKKQIIACLLTMLFLMGCAPRNEDIILISNEINILYKKEAPSSGQIHLSNKTEWDYLIFTKYYPDLRDISTKLNLDKESLEFINYEEMQHEIGNNIYFVKGKHITNKDSVSYFNLKRNQHYIVINKNETRLNYETSINSEGKKVVTIYK